MGTRVILNADDFGCSGRINAAVIQAHREGVLTSASLMVTGEAMPEAVSLARAHPTLAVGLHLVVAGGRAAMPPAELPHLVDDRGRFPSNPFLAGLRYFFSRPAREELRREMAAQFARFAATGLPLSHVDCHLHLHLHPVVFRRLLPLAEQYGARGLRLPRDDFWLAFGHDRRRAMAKAVEAAIVGLLCRWWARVVRRRDLVLADRVYGCVQSGRMREDYVLRVLRRLRVPVAELYFHPSSGPGREARGPNPGDLASLLSPAVRGVIRERGLSLTTYLALGEGSRADA